jgi:hypothetical protein
LNDSPGAVESAALWPVAAISWRSTGAACLFDPVNVSKMFTRCKIQNSTLLDPAGFAEAGIVVAMCLSQMQ